MKITEIKLDLDGCFADFNRGVKRLTGKYPNEIPKREMWKAIARDKTFFETLELMEDAQEMWDYIVTIDLPREVLTGLPTVNDGAGQKRRWVAKTLCDKIKVNVVASKDKHLHSGPGKLLIDDRQDIITPWVNAGGIGILHRSAVETIGQLKALGL